MNDSDLEGQLAAELTALETLGATMPLSFRPREAWFLLQLLQKEAMVGDAPTPEALAWAKSLAKNLEERLGNGRPAIAEAARRGWDQRHDVKAEAAECPRPVERDEPPTEKRPPAKPPGKRR